MTFLELAKRIMEEERRPLSPDEIWKTAMAKKGYVRLLRSGGKTPWATLGAQLYVSVRDKKDTPFVRVGTRPTRFYLRELLTVSEPEQLQQREGQDDQRDEKDPDYDERDLHPFVSYYASLYLRAYTKTIHHLKSQNKQYGEWIHPDMVGCYFPLWVI